MSSSPLAIAFARKVISTKPQNCSVKGAYHENLISTLKLLTPVNTEYIVSLRSHLSKKDGQYEFAAAAYWRQRCQQAERLARTLQDDMTCSRALDTDAVSRLQEFSKERELEASGTSQRRTNTSLQADRTPAPTSASARERTMPSQTRARKRKLQGSTEIEHACRSLVVKLKYRRQDGTPLAPLVDEHSLLSDVKAMLDAESDTRLIEGNRDDWYSGVSGLHPDVVARSVIAATYRISENGKQSLSVSSPSEPQAFKAACCSLANAFDYIRSLCISSSTENVLAIGASHVGLNDRSRIAAWLIQSLRQLIAQLILQIKTHSEHADVTERPQSQNRISDVTIRVALKQAFSNGLSLLHDLISHVNDSPNQNTRSVQSTAIDSAVKIAASLLQQIIKENGQAVADLSRPTRQPPIDTPSIAHKVQTDLIRELIARSSSTIRSQLRLPPSSPTTPRSIATMTHFLLPLLQLGVKSLSPTENASLDVFKQEAKRKLQALLWTTVLGDVVTPLVELDDDLPSLDEARQNAERDLQLGDGEPPWFLAELEQLMGVDIALEGLN
ncbi:MAG: hypothetical protein Q9162_005661 [Coniocarpon cinnabarinum]